eukprot:749337-Hanusia_phi.AAC.2
MRHGLKRCSMRIGGSGEGERGSGEGGGIVWVADMVLGDAFAIHVTGTSHHCVLRRGGFSWGWGLKLFENTLPTARRIFCRDASTQTLAYDGGTQERGELQEDVPNSETNEAHRGPQNVSELQDHGSLDSKVLLIRKRRAEFHAKREERLAKIAAGESGLGKVRQHVNPLGPHFRTPIPAPIWKEVYEHPEQDLHIDLGCGKGRLLFELAGMNKDMNYLGECVSPGGMSSLKGDAGVEIRELLVARADRWTREEGRRNCYFVYGNINVSVESLLSSYPGKIQMVSVLMPDPWFKKRHQKRRLLQPELVQQLGELMPQGAKFFIMSDVRECAESMVEIMDASPLFNTWDGVWIESPLPLATERESSCMSRGEQIYRAVYTRL